MPGPVEVRTAVDAPQVVQAAQVAFRIMGVLKVNAWADVLGVEDATERVVLTDEQQQLLVSFRGILPYLHVSPLVTVHGCPVCGMFYFADTATATSKCTLTRGCEGKLKAATKSPVRAAKTTDD